jgi:hypothetical protein
MVNERVWEWERGIDKKVSKSRSLNIITLFIYLYFFKKRFILTSNNNKWTTCLISIRRVENN